MGETAVAYRGVVSESEDTIVLKEGATLPRGTEVIVSPVPPEELRRGSPRAIYEAFTGGPHLDPGDVEELMRIIEESRLPTDWNGPFTDDMFADEAGDEP